jgi:hypothetical protein
MYIWQKRHGERWAYHEAYQGNIAIASIGQIWQPPMEKDVLVENNVQPSKTAFVFGYATQVGKEGLLARARHAVTEPQAQRLQ